MSITLKQAREAMEVISKFLGQPESSIGLDYEGSELILESSLSPRSINGLNAYYNTYIDPVNGTYNVVDKMTVNDLRLVELSKLKKARGLGKKSVMEILAFARVKGVSLKY